MNTGRCLCGAVRVEVENLATTMSACHCGMCRCWSGSVLLCMDGKGVQFTGPVKAYASSDFATRAWCDQCGSALWIHDSGSDVYDLMPGLFEDTAGASLTCEVYADQCLSGLAFASDNKHVTAAEYESQNLHSTGEQA